MLRFLLTISLSILLAYSPAVVSAVDSSKDQLSSVSSDFIKIEITGNRISLNVQHAEIVSVLKIVAEKAKIDLSIGATVHGRISLKMEDATIKEVLERLSGNTAFVFEYLPEEKVYRIVKAGTYASENPDRYALKAKSPVLKSRKKHAGMITSENTGGEKLLEAAWPSCGCIHLRAWFPKGGFCTSQVNCWSNLSRGCRMNKLSGYTRRSAARLLKK